MLTDTAIRSAKPGEKPVKIFDGEGLHLVVTPNGSKLWRLKFRHGGREKLLSIGPYPAIGLKAAREKRDEAKAQLARGIDPSAEKAKAKAAEKIEVGGTLKAAAEGYFTKLKAEGRTDATIEKNEWLFSFIPADIGSRQVCDIRAPELLAPLRALEARGLTQSAGRLRGLLGAIFRFAAASGLCDSDPTSLLRGALVQHRTVSRAALTDPKKFASLIRAVWSYAGQPETANCLKLMALLVPRPGELRMAEWSEFDLDAGVWEIPAGRMKMRRPHAIPLPSQAVEILRDHRRIVRQSKLVFPGLRSADRPISENTTNAALRRLGFSKEEATSHGFRASFSTMANESGLWHADAIERQLAHLEGNEVRRAYARGEHWDERVKMMGWWADTLDTMREAALEAPKARKIA